MLFRLFLLFTLLPALELYLLIRIGQWLGPAQTVLLILVTGAIGATLAKREGLSVLRQTLEEANQGFPSGDRLIEGLLVLVGGLLLITPGVLTDLMGFALIFPFTRRLLAPRLKAALLRRVASGDLRFTVMGAGGPRPPQPPPDAPRPPRFDHPVA